MTREYKGRVGGADFSVAYARPPQRNRRPRTRCLAVLGIVAAGALGGCGTGAGIGMLTVDPGRYSVYHCKDFPARKKELATKEKQLRELMERAGESPGGEVVGALTYRTQYEAVLSEEKLVQRAEAAKQCSAVQQPVLQSDQIIR
jgi:hypothetical protein